MFADRIDSVRLEELAVRHATQAERFGREQLPRLAALMADGAVKADGRPADVLVDEQLHAVFKVPLRVNLPPADGALFVLPQSAHHETTVI